MKVTNSLDHSEFAAMRVELMRDYAPQNALERLLVHEVAASWRRLDDARRREDLFFDLQKQHQAAENHQPPEALERHGAEVLMWLKDGHRAYDQVLRAIRDAGAAFDRAVRRLEAVVAARKKSERQAEKDQQHRESASIRMALLRERAAASVHTGNLVELAPPRPKSRSARPASARAPDFTAS